MESTGRLALADDATGALEIGARFSQAGLDARVRFDGQLGREGTATVVDTETRHDNGPEAYRKVREIAEQARRAGIEQVFYKTDSTLRGPIAAGFRALLDVWPERPLIYAPAYPALRRTVRNGELFVEGRRLCDTAFAADLLNPSSQSSIAALLGGLAGVRICDGETDQDLLRVAEEIRGTGCLVAGTAAMASAWAGGTARDWKPSAPVRRCLLVNGSLHPASREQLHHGGMAILEDATDLANTIDGCGWAALGGPAERGEPMEVSSRMARVAAETLRLAAPDCLVVFGGDTAIAILRELGVDEAAPHGEILPGVPASTILTDRPLLLVTKAGGFGTPDYLGRIRGILEST